MHVTNQPPVKKFHWSFWSFLIFFQVYLSAHADPMSSSDVTGAEWVSLGTLKGNVGDQAYTLPAEVDPAQFNSVVIWCAAVGVLFSPARLS